MSEPFKLLVIVRNSIGTSIATTTLNYQYQEQAEKAFWTLNGENDVRVIRVYSPEEQYKETSSTGPQ